MKSLRPILLLMMLPVLAAAQHNNMQADEAKQPFMARVGNRIIYHLYVNDTVVNYTGKEVKAVAINGSIPGPTLEFNEGDTAEIYVHNIMHMETSIHWHGLILPNEQDGVSYLTTAPIKGHETHKFLFPIVQHGTYWYHSHTMLQEQSGMYGAIVIHEKTKSATPEYTVLLSDWTNENPAQIERSLHYATDWYAIRKGSTQNYFEAANENKLGVKLQNEWKRMMAMDVSDVYYDRFFTNGKPVDEAPQFKAGDKVRLRVINGSSSTYFWLQFAGGKLTVVASDGADVEPVKVDRMIVGVSETYDVEVSIPADTSYEFLATAEDRTKSTSLWLGKGTKHAAEPMPKLKYFEGMSMMNEMMNADGSMNDMGMNMSLQKMDMNRVMYSEIVDSGKAYTALNYAKLKAPQRTTLPDGPVREMKFELTGNMNRYVWSINNKTVSEADKILIRQGENIRIVITNNTMMRHPMHLHGHYFRVLNGQGDYSPLKTVMDILPMETDTIEFHASEKYGDWFFHCHILYHMMSGMGRIFSYENSPPNPQLPDPASALKKIYHDDKRFYYAATVGLESNGSDGEMFLSNTRWMLQTEWRVGLNDTKGYESETHIGKLIGRNQWLMPYIGFDWRYRKNSGDEKNIFGQTNTKDERKTVCFGLQYTLPMLVKADARIDTDGKLRAQLSREGIPLTTRLRMSFMLNSDKEYMAGFRYIITKYISLSTHYDSDMQLGAGITVHY